MALFHAFPARLMQEWQKTPLPFQSCSIQKKCVHPAAPTSSQRPCIPTETVLAHTSARHSLCWLALPPAACWESYIGTVLHSWLVIIVWDSKWHSSRCTFVSSSNAHSFTLLLYSASVGYTAKCWFSLLLVSGLFFFFFFKKLLLQAREFPFFQFSEAQDLSGLFV